MNGSIRLMVTVTVDGGYYSDTDDLARHASSWIQSAFEDRDGIDAYGWSEDDINLTGGGIEIERVEVAQP